MRLLAIETATSAVGCALWSDDGLVASFALVAGKRHAEVLMPAIDEMLRRAGLAPAALEAVAVDVGPGLFTGLRVGLATAGSISLALGLPALGITSLEALAHPLRRRPGLVAPVVDARRGEVYFCAYVSDGQALTSVLAPAVATPQEAARQLGALEPVPSAPVPLEPQGQPSTVVIVGDGAWRYQDVFEGPGARLGGRAEMWPMASVVAEIAARRLELVAAGTGELPPPGTPSPVYLRQADVRIGWDQLDGRMGPDGLVAPAPAPVGPTFSAT